MSQEINQIPEEAFEIDIKDILKFIKNGYKTIFITIIIFIVLGVIIALLKNNEYSSGGKILPEVQSKSLSGRLGGLSSLAGLAGIDLNNLNSTDAIRPDLYPNIIQSTDFRLYILNQPFINNKTGKKIILKQYLKELNESSWGIGKWIEKVFGKKVIPTPKADNTSNIIVVSKEEEDLIKNIGERITSSMDKKTYIITVDVKMPDPIMAASVAAKSMEYLTNYVTEYRTSKAKSDVDFYVQRVAEIKKRKENLEYAFFSHTDANRNPFMQTAQIPQKKLEAEYILVKNLYDELNKQMEQSKIKLREETPVFKVLEPPVVPLLKSEPKRSLMVLGFAIVGGIVGILILLWKSYNPIKYLKEL